MNDEETPTFTHDGKRNTSQWPNIFTSGDAAIEHFSLFQSGFLHHASETIEGRIVEAV